MISYRLAPEAEADLDEIWQRIAQDSGSAAAATQTVERIVDRFWLFARYPRCGRPRDDLRPGLRSFPVADYIVIYRISARDLVWILHIVHASRDIRAWFPVE